jgi:uncharacterized protein (DUF488 family)
MATPAVTLWTLGHGHSELDDYLALLADNSIDTVVDIRSIPTIRFAPWFSRANFEPALISSGLEYVYLGDRLGGRPHGDQYYDAEGHTLYEPVSAEPWFGEGIEQLETLATSGRVALTCLEEEPERCHRHPLLGRVLQDRGATVLHIRRSGLIESQADVDQRMGSLQTSLLAAPVWRSPLPMHGGHNKP